MDNSTRMLQRTESEKFEPTEISGEKLQDACFKVAANGLKIENTNLSKIPKRKLSVFYRSFDVIVPVNQEKEKEMLEFRRTSSSPSVRIERTQEAADVENDENREPTSSCKRSFLNSYQSLTENGGLLKNKFSSSNDQSSKAETLSSTGFSLSRVREDTKIDNYATITETSIGKHFKLNNNGSGKFKNQRGEEKNFLVNLRENRGTPELNNFYSLTNAKTVINEKGDAFVDTKRNVATRSVDQMRSPGTNRCNDLVKIKDSEYPRSNATNSGRLGKYTSVETGMSSHEDSSIGSDSEDDSIKRITNSSYTPGELANREKLRSKGNASPRCSSTMIGALRKSEFHDEGRMEDARQEKRQRSIAVRRTLSEGDNEVYRRSKCHCKCTKEEESLNDKIEAFPSFTDSRLQDSGLSNSREIYRANIPEEELERKYIAFSIGLCTDRITLQRRMALALRHRDIAEKNLGCEIQKMEEGIEELLPLCVDGESIEKIERVQHQLDTIAQCARKVSSAAETLGAVHEEHRISKAICIADKYLHTLRARCETLATDIAETKQILLKNNIVIEESSGEIGDDLFKIRYRNGAPSNNRTVIARRRASIATISRPLTSQDIVKEGPRQRNSVSGRMTLRRPSFCSETQRWDSEKLNRTDSSNSVCELCDIFEQTESTRKNSVKESNSLSTEKDNEVDIAKCNINVNVDNDDRLTDKRTSFLETNVTTKVENRLNFCKITIDPLQINQYIVTWPTIVWCTLIFFLGFFTKHVTSSISTLGTSF